MAEFDPFARQIFSGNDYVTIESGNAIEVINPASLEPVGRIADCDAAVLDTAIQQARAAQRVWGGVDAKSRAALLHDIAHSIAAGDPAPVCELMTREVGKPYPESIGELANVDQGIAHANESRFGLGASILTTRMDEAMRAVEKIDSGMVKFNNPLVDSDALHFGGRKYSGIGGLFGRAGLNSFRQIKMVTIDAKPTLQDWWYPYPDDRFHSGPG